MSNAAMSKEEVIMVTTKRVSCDGGGGALGHPRVWLEMGEDNDVRCKYCDRVYRLDPHAKPADH